MRVSLPALRRLRLEPLLPPLLPSTIIIIVVVVIAAVVVAAVPAWLPPGSHRCISRVYFQAFKMEDTATALKTESRGAGGTREYKIVMLGPGGVGKSAMTMQFISHRFPEDHDPTIEDAYKTQVRIDDETAHLDILDTAGQAEFTAMRDQYMRAGEGFIICYSITDRRSFQEAAQFKQLIYQVRHTYEVPVVLVGNKTDLGEIRQVSQEEGRSLAREFSCQFFETSAALRQYVDEVFYAVVREIRRKEHDAMVAMERRSKRKESLWKKLKGSLKSKKRENVT